MFDSKVAGEASSKAARRLPPFQQDECRRLLDAVRRRHGAPEELPDGDVYLFLDGGRGIMDRMTPYFAGKLHVSKTLHIHLDPDNVTKRMDRARGVAVQCPRDHQDLRRALAEGASLLASSALQRHYCNQWAGARGPARHSQPVACVLACQEKYTANMA